MPITRQIVLTRPSVNIKFDIETTEFLILEHQFDSLRSTANGYVEKIESYSDDNLIYTRNVVWDNNENVSVFSNTNISFITEYWNARRSYCSNNNINISQNYIIS